MVKKWFALLVLVTLLPFPALSEQSPLDDGSHTLEKRTVPVFFTGRQDYRSVDDRVLIAEFPLYYVDHVKDLPYVDLTDFTDLMNRMNASSAENKEDDGKSEKTYAASAVQDAFTCTYLPQNSAVTVDFREGTLTYTAFDTFGKDPAHSPFEIQTNTLDFLQRIYKPHYSHIGDARTVPLAEYGIPMYAEDGKYLLPLHTAYDFLIWAPKAPSVLLCCNGEAVFFGENEYMFGYTDSLSDLGEKYFAAQPAKRSPELAKYGYMELCLLLDSFYGLKDSHHIGSFQRFFRANGYEERLMSADAGQADQALMDVITFVLDDLHSSFSFPSWMSGHDKEPTEEESGFSSAIHERNKASFESASLRAFPEGMDFYTEYGNTAYLTIQMLTSNMDSERFYDADVSQMSGVTDTIGQVLYADRQINRENSPVENVVLDLSLCPGGDVNSAAFVISWFLGEGFISIANTFSGGLGITHYRADVNRDHLFTEADSLAGKKNLFCLISPLTFSSGNLTAAMLKTSHAVTFLGQTSRGGSGMNTPAVTGWDTMFFMSGFRNVVTVKNGSICDADPGVVPDVYLSDPDLFYDRARLTEKINALK